MTEADRPRFAGLLVRLCDYYRTELSAMVIGMYWTALERFPMDAIEHAAELHVQSPDRGQWLPKAADLIALLQGNTSQRAALAWTAVREAVRSVGPYRSVVFDDPLTQAIVHEMGGWGALNEMQSRDVPFRQKEFVERYTAWMEKRQLPDYPAVLGGMHAGPPVLLGDSQRALAVQRREVLALGYQPEKLNDTACTHDAP